MGNLDKLKEIKDALNNKFIERDKEIEAILIALLSRQHMLMIGPAGTGKSALSAELSNIIDGSSYFQWLLTKFSTPEELFGPLSLKELENGVYKRNVKSKMPEAHIVFLDEIFKANSAILNSLLTLINERLFYNNSQPVSSPLMTVVGSSNEYPEEDEGLEALFDRFLLRFEIDYIGDESNFISMLKGQGQNQTMPSMTLKELENLQFLCDMVMIPDEVYEALSAMRIDLKDQAIHPSDRRFKQSLSILQAKALTEQRQEVKLKDLLVLEHTLWENVDQKVKVSEIVQNRALDVVSKKILEVETDVDSVMAAMDDPNQDKTEIVLEANKKIQTMLKELKELKTSHPSRSEIDVTISKIQGKQREISEFILDPIEQPNGEGEILKNGMPF
ncbi:AAA family ATPase [Oceanobacillus oncorhynchi]|uniref:AAA family ATPase n=1 Tax=Oceanobacillus oncorhynchi TaxID=545501 RepID=UPI001866B765|nr:AAA family ATPase [Oceanobacillus oncorhynchi]